MTTTNQPDWRTQLRNLITCGYSYNQVLGMFCRGQITARVWEGYCRVWHFLNVRLSSRRQDAFYRRFGLAATYRRINRTRAAFGFAPISS